jgi:hypothetical protein
LFAALTYPSKGFTFFPGAAEVFQTGGPELFFVQLLEKPIPAPLFRRPRYAIPL